MTDAKSYTPEHVYSDENAERKILQFRQKKEKL